MPNYKEMTQEEAVVLWESGVHTVEYSTHQSDNWGAPAWLPFVPTPYFWESPYQHWAERWRVETE